MFYWLVDVLSEDPIPRDAGDFRLISRRVIEELRRIDEPRPYLRGTIATMGFNQKGIDYARRPVLWAARSSLFTTTSCWLSME